MDRLKHLSQWVCWKHDPTHGKIPINPKTGGNAQSNNPMTWETYEQASKLISKHDGIGFMLVNGICGIDIDDAVGNPAIERMAEEIIAYMNTYTEYSPSRKGYHIIFKVDERKLPPSDKYKEMYYQKNTQKGIECYISSRTNRFLTFTGEAINSLNIEDRTSQLLAFLEKHMKKNTNPPPLAKVTGESVKENTSITADDVIRVAQSARNGNNFLNLFRDGNISKYKNDDSSADMALCKILAFWCGNSPALIDQVFRKSALYRDKWEREDYRTHTIENAISQQNGTFYDWTKEPTPRKPQKDITAIMIKKHAGAAYFNPFDSIQKKQRYQFNDKGVGYLFADVYKKIARFVPEVKTWYVYDGLVWRADTDSLTVSQLAKDLTDHMLDWRKYIADYDTRESWTKFVNGRTTKKARDTMLEDAKSVHPIGIMDFDSNKYLFNCKNGTLDLTNFTLHEHRPEDLISKVSNVTYDPSLKCARWEQFINEVMCNDIETAKFQQKALGYALTADTSEECFFILYGNKTRNGKGTTMETILNIMGDYGRTAQPETIGQKQFSNGSAPSEDIARLKGARFVNMSEPDKGLRLNTALVKQITGGDSVTARFLHQNSFEFRPEFKLFINTNHLPKVNDDSIFASGRVKLIPFSRHFSETEQDKGLKDFFKLPHNMSGILNWLIEGLKLKNAEGLEQPPSVKDATNQYREDSDTIGLFISEILTECRACKTLIKEIYDRYRVWCEEYGYSPLNSRNFISELRSKGLEVKPSTGNKTYLFNYRFCMDAGVTAITEHNMDEIFTHDTSTSEMSALDLSEFNER